ncbi:MAG TPA: DUF2723 domain-containing protein, partial [bacterium]|nr:DUF2723 domain-containing protein [bacterium]
MAALPDESPVAPPESGPSRPLIPPAVYPWLALLVPLLVYLLGACPVVYVGDAGDFVTASWTLGISHPPGYPLYTLLGWLFTHLPIPGGEAPAAFRMNLMSGVFGAITSYLAYLLLARTTGVPLLALLGALAVTFSRALWTQATITEVYTLNTCFILWQWWLTVRYAEEGRPRRLWIWLLVAMGLSLAHHYSILMFFPFMFWYVVALTGALWPGDRMGIVGGDTKRAGTVGGDVVPAQVRPLTTELWQGLAYVLSPMFLLYCYLPLVKFQTPVSETRPLPYLGKGVGEFLRYWWLDTVGRGVYSYRPQVEGATTTPQVF